MRHEPQRRSPIDRCPTSRYIWTERDEEDDDTDGEEADPEADEGADNVNGKPDDTVESSQRAVASLPIGVGAVLETGIGSDGDNGTAEARALVADVSSAPMGESALVSRGRGMGGDDEPARRGAECSGDAAVAVATKADADNIGAGGESVVVICDAPILLRGAGEAGSSPALVELAQPIS
jgi:hypothetical protein